MPKYLYVCDLCAADHEITISIHDDMPASIPCTCSGNMSRVYSTFGLILKGTGWGKSK